MKRRIEEEEMDGCKAGRTAGWQNRRIECKKA